MAPLDLLLMLLLRAAAGVRHGTNRLVTFHRRKDRRRLLKNDF